MQRPAARSQEVRSAGSVRSVVTINLSAGPPRWRHRTVMDTAGHSGAFPPTSGVEATDRPRSESEIPTVRSQTEELEENYIFPSQAQGVRASSPPGGPSSLPAVRNARHVSSDEMQRGQNGENEIPPEHRVPVQGSGNPDTPQPGASGSTRTTTQNHRHVPPVRGQTTTSQSRVSMQRPHRSIDDSATNASNMRSTASRGGRPNGQSLPPSTDDRQRLRNVPPVRMLSIPPPYSLFVQKVREQMEKEWSERFMAARKEDGAPIYRQTKHFFPTPDLEKSKLILKNDRETVSKFIQFITGHGWLKRHAAIIARSGGDMTADALCSLCGEKEETPIHLIEECDAIYWDRDAIFCRKDNPLKYGQPGYLLQWSVRKLEHFFKIDKIRRLLERASGRPPDREDDAAGHDDDDDGVGHGGGTPPPPQARDQQDDDEDDLLI